MNVREVIRSMKPEINSVAFTENEKDYVILRFPYTPNSDPGADPGADHYYLIDYYAPVGQGMYGVVTKAYPIDVEGNVDKTNPYIAKHMKHPEEEFTLEEFQNRIKKEVDFLRCYYPKTEPLLLLGNMGVIIMPLVGNESLQKVITNADNAKVKLNDLGFAQRVNLLAEIANAYNIIHAYTPSTGEALFMSDIKADNINVSFSQDRNRVDIFPLDFGFANIVYTEDIITTDPQGTKEYCPPELLQDKGGVKFDIWSFIPDFLTILGAKNPTKFRDEIKNLTQKYFDTEYDFDGLFSGFEMPEYPIDIKPYIIRFLKYMMAHDYDQRPSKLEFLRFFTTLNNFCLAFIELQKLQALNIEEDQKVIFEAEKEELLSHIHLKSLAAEKEEQLRQIHLKSLAAKKEEQLRQIQLLSKKMYEYAVKLSILANGVWQHSQVAPDQTFEQYDFDSLKHATAQTIKTTLPVNLLNVLEAIHEINQYPKKKLFHRKRKQVDQFIRQMDQLIYQQGAGAAFDILFARYLQELKKEPNSLLTKLLSNAMLKALGISENSESIYEKHTEIMRRVQIRSTLQQKLTEFKKDMVSSLSYKLTFFKSSLEKRDKRLSCLESAIKDLEANRDIQNINFPRDTWEFITAHPIAEAEMRAIILNKIHDSISDIEKTLNQQPFSNQQLIISKIKTKIEQSRAYLSTAELLMLMQSLHITSSLARNNDVEKKNILSGLLKQFSNMADLKPYIRYFKVLIDDQHQKEKLLMKLRKFSEKRDLNPLLKSFEQKRTALRKLCEQIENSTDKDFQSLVDDWRNTDGKIVYDSRSRFFANNDAESDTAKFMKKLEEKYGSVICKKRLI